MDRKSDAALAPRRRARGSAGNLITTAQVVRHGDANAFLAHAEEWLLSQEADNNVLLSVAYLLAKGAKPFDQPAYLATVETGSRIVGCAMHAPPDGVYLTEIPVQATRVIAGQLGDMFVNVPEVIAPESVAMEFAQLWRPDSWTVHSRLQRYTLDSVIPPRRPARGALRLGTREDHALIDEWASDYKYEVRANTDVAAFFRTMIERHGLFLWDDGGPRCVVTASGHTPNGVRISAAYTPATYRGHGYGTSAVAAVSRRVLAGKRFCVIAADAADPVPNNIYRSIGYVPSGRLAMIHLG